MSSPTSASAAVRPHNIPLEVFRVPAGDPSVVRMLSNAYRGVFTHWVGKSQVCPGLKCTCQYAKKQRVWKGFACAERWVEKPGYWVQCAFELTEACENSMRNGFGRGTVWQCRRVIEEGRSHEKVIGILLETIPSDKLPSEFDLEQAMRRLFHIVTVPPHVPNPSAPKALAQISDDYIPPHLREKLEQRQATPDEVRELTEGLRKRLGTFGKDPAIRNGVH
jgi:hypothetical protein